MILLLNFIFESIWIFCVLIPNIIWYNEQENVIKNNYQIYKCLDKKVLRKIAKYLIMGSVNFWKLLCCVFHKQTERKWYYTSMIFRRYFVISIVTSFMSAGISLFNGIVPNLIMLIVLLYEIYISYHESYSTLDEEQKDIRLIKLRGLDDLAADETRDCVINVS